MFFYLNLHWKSKHAGMFVYSVKLGGKKTTAKH